jgi:hypothetical protein
MLTGWPTSAPTCGITCGRVERRLFRPEAGSVRDEFDAFGFQDGFDGAEGYGSGGSFFGAEDG